MVITMNLVLGNQKIPIKVAHSWYAKIKGLSFKKNINYGLYIPNCISIHTIYMQDNIDILFLNEKNVILYIYQNIPKGKIVMVDEDIKKTSVLELPKNTSMNLRIGDVLTFEFENIV